MAAYEKWIWIELSALVRQLSRTWKERGVVALSSGDGDWE